MYHSIFQTMDDIKAWGTTYAIYKAVKCRGLFSGLYQVFVASKMIKHSSRLMFKDASRLELF